MPSEVVPWIPVIGSFGGVLLGGVISLLGGMIGQWMGLRGSGKPASMRQKGLGCGNGANSK